MTLRKKPSRKRRAAQPTPFGDPANLEPIDPEEFQFAFSLGFAASAMRMPSVSPSKFGITIVDEGAGSRTRLTFTDKPENRMAFAVKDHFNDPSKFTSFMMRFWALLALRDDPRMAEYTKRYESDDAIGIHASVLEAAASLPLSKDLQFDPDSFFARAADLRASRHYEGEPED